MKTIIAVQILYKMTKFFIYFFPSAWIKPIHALCEIPHPVMIVDTPAACHHNPGSICYLVSESKMNRNQALKVHIMLYTISI